MRVPRWQVTIAVVSSVTALVVGSWMLASQIPDGDVTLALMSLEDASYAVNLFRSGSVAGPPQEYVREAEGVDLYLVSDTAPRLPAITRRIGRISLALDAEYELTRMVSVDQTMPSLAGAPDIAAAVDAFPDVARFVVEVAGERRLDNSGDQAMLTLNEIASNELQAAWNEAIALRPDGQAR